MSKYFVGLFVLQQILLKFVFIVTGYNRMVKPGVFWYVGLCCAAGNVFVQQFRDGKMLHYWCWFFEVMKREVDMFPKKFCNGKLEDVLIPRSFTKAFD